MSKRNWPQCETAYFLKEIMMIPSCDQFSCLSQEVVRLYNNLCIRIGTDISLRDNRQWNYTKTTQTQFSHSGVSQGIDVVGHMWCLCCAQHNINTTHTTADHGESLWCACLKNLAFKG